MHLSLSLPLCFLLYFTKRPILHHPAAFELLWKGWMRLSEARQLKLTIKDWLGEGGRGAWGRHLGETRTRGSLLETVCSHWARVLCKDGEEDVEWGKWWGWMVMVMMVKLVRRRFIIFPGLGWFGGSTEAGFHYKAGCSHHKEMIIFGHHHLICISRSYSGRKWRDEARNLRDRGEESWTTSGDDWWSGYHDHDGDW